MHCIVLYNRKLIIEIKKIEINFIKNHQVKLRVKFFGEKVLKKIYRVDAGFVSFSYSKFTVDPESLWLSGGAV